MLVGPAAIRCLLMGHDDIVRRAPDRIFLECFDCGRSTAGWSLGPAASRQNRDARQGVKISLDALGSALR